jgi:hypothetical protein
MQKNIMVGQEIKNYWTVTTTLGIIDVKYIIVKG